MDVISLAPRLPVELFYHVFEHSTKATLVACSTVCKQWSSMSRPYRFYDVSLWCNPVDEEIQRAEDGEVEDWEIAVKEPKKTLSSFLRFLEASPRIANSIHKLNIDMRSPFGIITAYDTDHMSFVSVLRSLPQLKTLVLQDVFLPNWQSEVLTDIKLDHLTVGHPKYHSREGGTIESNEIMRMLSLFGSVGSISLEHMYIEGVGPEAEELPFPLQSGVTSLVLRDMGTLTALLGSIARGSIVSGNHAHLRRLEIYDLCKDELHQMNSFLEITGHQYQHFACCIPLEVLADGGSPILKLSKLTQLRSLVLRMRMVGATFPALISDNNENAWKYLLKVLEGIPFKSTPVVLDQLTLNIHFTSGLNAKSQSVQREDLSKVASQITAVEDRLLEWVEKRVVRGVRIEFAQSRAEGATLDATLMSEFLPRLDNTGILSLSK